VIPRSGRTVIGLHCAVDLVAGSDLSLDQGAQKLN
jgi:hypothetical protein